MPVAGMSRHVASTARFWSVRTYTILKLQRARAASPNIKEERQKQQAAP